MAILLGIYCVSLDEMPLVIAVAGLMISLLIFGALAIYALLRLRAVLADKERRDLIAEQQELIWIDYHFSPQHMEVFGDIGELTEKERLDLMGAEVYEVYDWVYQEDSSIRSAVHQFFDSGDRYFKAELRLRRRDGEYCWYHLMGTLVKDRVFEEKNLRFVVNLENVDSQLAQEKNLVHKAETDLLTGIYNKKTMEEKISDALMHRSEDESYIFFMVDLDNFKSVNDTLGHIYGDQVLKEAADKLIQAFPHGTMVGRLGGDEFAVCTNFKAFDASNLMEYMEQKGEHLCNVLRANYCCDALSVDVSASIGIASAPGDGTDFMTVYQKADKALYLSKRSGKDRYNIFQKSDADE